MFSATKESTAGRVHTRVTHTWIFDKLDDHFGELPSTSDVTHQFCFEVGNNGHMNIYNHVNQFVGCRQDKTYFIRQQWQNAEHPQYRSANVAPRLTLRHHRVCIEKVKWGVRQCSVVFSVIWEQFMLSRKWWLFVCVNKRVQRNLSEWLRPQDTGSTPAHILLGYQMLQLSVTFAFL